MKLWMWYAPGTDDQIEQACQVGENTLKDLGLTPAGAFQAAMAANELDEGFGSDFTPDQEGVDGWYAAEFAAFSHLATLCGEWPAQASLIVTTETT